MPPRFPYPYVGVSSARSLMGIVQDPYRHYTGTQDRAVFTSRFDTPIYGSGVFFVFSFSRWYNPRHATDNEFPDRSSLRRRYMRALCTCLSLRLNLVLPVPNPNRFGIFYSPSLRGRLCSSPEAISRNRLGDCFVGLPPPRNDGAVGWYNSPVIIIILEIV